MTTHTVPGLLDAAAGTTNGITFYDGTLAERHVPYVELARHARAAARVLRAHGVERGDRVCLLGSTSPEFLTALFGAWYAGAVPVILPHQRPRVALADYVADVGVRIDQVRARFLLVGERFVEVADAGVGIPAIALDELWVASESRSPGVAIDPDDVAFLQFTSGSTGRSRAVTLTHRQMLGNVASITGSLGLGVSWRWVSWLPMYHDMGLISMLTMVANGMRAYLQPTEDFARAPRSWMAAVSKFRASISVGPNFAWGLAARTLAATKPGELDLSQLRIAGNGAEPINVADLECFVEAAGAHGMGPDAVSPMYGMAEATLAVTASPPGAPMRDIAVVPDRLHQGAVVHRVGQDAEFRRRIVSCGPPMPGIEVAIRAADGTTLGEGAVGEVCVRSPGIMTGYWENPEATAAAVRDGWLHTGDLGFLDQGELFVCGRLKDMIIVGGRNLYPEDYEHLAATVPGIRRGNAIAFGLTELERMVVVAETPRKGDHAQEIARELMRALRDRLPHAPHEVVLVTSGTLPKTSSGKVQRRLCQALYLDGRLPVVASIDQAAA